MAAPPITIGIPTYCGADRGEGDILGMCLKAIRVRSCTDIPYHIVVVDDSGDGARQARSRAVAEMFGARWTAHTENRGVAAGWNTLVRASYTPYIALLNDDFYVSRGWIDALLYFLRENPRAGSAGLAAFFTVLEDVPQLLGSPDAVVTPRDYFTKQPAPEEAAKRLGHEQPGRCMAPPGCGFGFRREMYDAVGGFDESLGKGFYEETMFGTSCAALGFSSYTLQHPNCYTIMSATFSRCTEFHGRDLFTGPRHKYVEKWSAKLPELAAELAVDLAKGGGGTYPIHRTLMGRIPFQMVKWLDVNGVARHELITGEEGFYEGSK